MVLELVYSIQYPLRAMNFVCRTSRLRGTVEVPGSKSHTVRAVAIASLASGASCIEAPLDSADTQATVRAYRALGAHIDTRATDWIVTGTAGELTTPEDVIDVANSGTTMNVAIGSAALLRRGMAVLTGDDQVRRRPNGPLLNSLCELGAWAASTRGNGSPPVVVRGRLRGGTTVIECQTSQFLSSLLINCPLGDGDTTIRVPVLNEAPYVDMTLDWLTRLGIRFERDGYREFRVPGGQRYDAFTRRVPADFSSATFFLCAGALQDNDVVVKGLDLEDTQGDKAVLKYLRQMGARVDALPEGVRVRPGDLRGCKIDLNATPDALPMMGVVGCFAKGTTRLVNVPQARMKECDRIAAMRQELERLGAKVRELPDGLEIEQSVLHGARVDGHADHRIVMALTVAGCCIPNDTVVTNAESVSVTFPGFADCMKSLGASLRIAE